MNSGFSRELANLVKTGAGVPVGDTLLEWSGQNFTRLLVAMLPNQAKTCDEENCTWNYKWHRLIC